MTLRFLIISLCYFILMFSTYINRKLHFSKYSLVPRLNNNTDRDSTEILKLNISWKVLGFSCNRIHLSILFRYFLVGLIFVVFNVMATISCILYLHQIFTIWPNLLQSTWFVVGMCLRTPFYSNYTYRPVKSN